MKKKELKKRLKKEKQRRRMTIKVVRLGWTTQLKLEKEIQSLKYIIVCLKEKLSASGIDPSSLDDSKSSTPPISLHILDDGDDTKKESPEKSQNCGTVEEQLESSSIHPNVLAEISVSGGEVLLYPSIPGKQEEDESLEEDEGEMKGRVWENDFREYFVTPHGPGGFVVCFRHEVGPEITDGLNEVVRSFCYAKLAHVFGTRGEAQKALDDYALENGWSDVSSDSCEVGCVGIEVEGESLEEDERQRNEKSLEDEKSRGLSECVRDGESLEGTTVRWDEKRPQWIRKDAWIDSGGNLYEVRQVTKVGVEKYERLKHDEIGMWYMHFTNIGGRIDPKKKRFLLGSSFPSLNVGSQGRYDTREKAIRSLEHYAGSIHTDDSFEKSKTVKE